MTNQGRDYNYQNAPRNNLPQTQYVQQPSLPRQGQQVLPTYPANQYSRGALTPINATRTPSGQSPEITTSQSTQALQYPRTAYPQSLPDPQFNR